VPPFRGLVGGGVADNHWRRTCGDVAGRAGVAAQAEARRVGTALTRQLKAWGLHGKLAATRRSYARTPVITEDRFRAMVGLLGIFARQLGGCAGMVIAENHDEPPCACAAKKFAQEHLGEKISMRDAARHVHLSSFYFSRVFKQATGKTFTEYLARTRVEKAKALLVNPFMRVTEAAYDSGFQAIPHFNSVFKQYVGKFPTEYRASLRAEFHI